MCHANGRAGRNLPVLVLQDSVEHDSRHSRCNSVGKAQSFLYKECEIRQPLKLSEVCNSVVGGLDALQFPSEFLQHGRFPAQVVGDNAPISSQLTSETYGWLLVL